LNTRNNEIERKDIFSKNINIKQSINMKKSLLFSLFLCIAVLKLPAQTCPNNLLQNAGFENGITNWDIYGNATITTDVNTGTKAIKLCTGRMIQTIAVQAGKTYKLSAFAKLDVGTTGSFYVKWLSSQFMPLGSSTTVTPVGVGYFAVEITSLIPPTNAAFMEVNMDKSSGAGCFFADDFCLIDINGGGGQLPDIIISQASLPTTLLPGALQNFTAEIKNIGSVPTTSNLTVGAYLSIDNTLDVNDLKVGTEPLPAILQPNGFQTISGSINIPTGTLAGNYFLFLKADDSNANAESNETNNTFSIGTNIPNSPTDPGTCQIVLPNLNDANIVCAKQTTTGFTLISLTTDNQYRQRDFNTDGDLTNSSLLGAAPEQAILLVENNKIVKKDLNSNIIYQQNLPVALNLTSGFACEVPGGGWYVAYSNSASPNNSGVVLRVNAAGQVTATINNLPFSLANGQTVFLVAALPNSEILVGGGNGPNPNTGTDFVKINANYAIVSGFAFSSSGIASSFQPSPCVSGNYIINGFKNSGGGSGGSSQRLFFKEIQLTATGAKDLWTCALSSQFQQPGNSQRIEESNTFLPNGDRLHYQFSSSYDATTQISTSTKTLEKLSSAGVVLWTKNLPAQFTGRGCFFLFEKTGNNAIAFANFDNSTSVWRYNSGCTPTGGGAITVNCPVDMNFTECPQFSLTGPVCLNCHAITAPTATTTCAQGGVQVVFDSYTILSVNNTTPGNPMTINPTSGFGLVTQGFGQAAVKFKITDACGNQTFCTYKITVNRIDPITTLTSCPTNITVTASAGQTGAVVNYLTPTAASACFPPVVSQQVGLPSGSNFPIGTTNNVWVASNILGTLPCNFNVVVNPFGGGGTCTGNLLQNAGYEANLTNWDGGGEVATVVNTGTKALKICTNCVAVRQTITATAGKSYTISVFAKKDAGVSGVVGIKFLSAAYIPLAQDYSGVTASTYTQMSKTIIAPVGTARLEVSLLKDTGTGCIFADDWCVSEGGGTGGGGADLELTMTADKTNVPQWNTVTYTLTAKNTGTTTITSAFIAVGGCEGGVLKMFDQTYKLVYAGTPAAPTAGAYNFFTQNWTLTNLAAGQSGVLTFQLFATGTSEKKVVAFAKTQSPTDPDSQPSVTPPVSCTPVQDDEAVWTINMGQGLLAQGERAFEAEKTFFEKMSFLDAYSVFPNPAGESVFVKMPDSQLVTKVSLLNQMGLVEKIQEFTPTSSTNNETGRVHEFPLQNVSNGVYFMKIETAGQRTVVRKLVVSRMY
jgi:hypothetical protein